MEIDIFEEFQTKIDSISDHVALFEVSQLFPEIPQQQLLRDILKSIIELKEMKGKIENNVRDKFVTKGKNECIRLKELYCQGLIKLRDYILRVNEETTVVSESRILGASYADTITKDTITLSEKGEFNLTINDIFIKFYSVVINFNIRLNKIQSGNSNFIKEIIPITNEIVSPKRENNTEIKFRDLFDNTAYYDFIVQLLIDENFIDPHSYIWIDTAKGSKSLLIAILRDLRTKKYYKDAVILTLQMYKDIAKNTFGVTLSIPSVKASKTKNNLQRNLIPYTSSFS